MSKESKKDTKTNKRKQVEELRRKMRRFELTDLNKLSLLQEITVAYLDAKATVKNVK